MVDLIHSNITEHLLQSIVYISSTRTVPASHGPHPPSHGHVQGWARAEILNV